MVLKPFRPIDHEIVVVRLCTILACPSCSLCLSINSILSRWILSSRLYSILLWDEPVKPMRKYRFNARYSDFSGLIRALFDESRVPAEPSVQDVYL